MISAKEARLSIEDGMSFLDKKLIYEMNTINSLIGVKVASKEKVLVYVVYKSSLNQKDFVLLLKNIKTKLKDHGYNLLRIFSEDSSYYIFRIDWVSAEEV